MGGGQLNLVERVSWLVGADCSIYQKRMRSKLVTCWANPIGEKV